MSSGVQIREIGPEEAEVLALLLTELNGEVGVGGLPPGADREPDNALVTREQIATRLKAVAGLETVLLAEVEGAAAGFVALRLTPYLDQDVPYAEVTQLHVRPQFRRRGVAGRLMRAAEDLAAGKGCTSVHLVANHDNYDAHAFYKAAGYEPLFVGFEKFIETAGRTG